MKYLRPDAPAIRLKYDRSRDAIPLRPKLCTQVRLESLRGQEESNKQVADSRRGAAHRRYKRPHFSADRALCILYSKEEWSQFQLESFLLLSRGNECYRRTGYWICSPRALLEDTRELYITDMTE